MGIFIFTKKEASLKTLFPKSTQFFPLPLADYAPGNVDLTYVDITDLSPAEYKKTLAQLKECCADSQWGIIDPKGTVKDIAALFFEGASDYLGPTVLKGSEGIEAKHLKEAQIWRKEFKNAVISAKEVGKAGKGTAASLPKTGIKLPAASSFPGWNKMPSGKNAFFYLLHCSLHGKNPLDTKLDDKALAQVHKRFANFLDNNLEKGNGLFWVNSGKDCLFLLPPIAKCAEEAIKSCIGMLVSAPLIVMETLGVKFPVNIAFSLHYGSLNYKPPGRTGTVVSDAVNFIYHLGLKKAEPGRLSISGELPDGTIPKSLEDIFVYAGEFEDRKIWHTKKFEYAKPWV